MDLEKENYKLTKKIEGLEAHIRTIKREMDSKKGELEDISFKYRQLQVSLRGVGSHFALQAHYETYMEHYKELYLSMFEENQRIHNKYGHFFEDWDKKHNLST